MDTSTFVAKIDFNIRSKSPDLQSEATDYSTRLSVLISEWRATVGWILQTRKTFATRYARKNNGALQCLIQFE